MRRIPISSLNLLRCFEAAGRLMSFREAARELRVTPAAVSQQVRQLEQELGLPLFERLHRGLAFTNAGERYFRDVHEHLAAIARGTDAVRVRYRRTILRASIMPPVASRIVLPAMDEFQDLHPDVELRVATSIRNADLSAHEADVAVRFGRPPWTGCRHQKLSDVYVLPVCSPQMARLFDLGAQPAQLARMPLIHMTDRPDTWVRFFEHTGLGPAQPEREYYVDDYPAAIEAAERLGVALAMLPPEQSLIDTERLVAPMGRIGPLAEKIYAVWPKRTDRAGAVEAFIAWLAVRLQK